MNQLVRTAARTLGLTLAAALAFAAFAQEDLNFGVFADDGRMVGTVEVDFDDRYIDVDLLRGFEGLVRIVVPGADGVNQVFDGAIGPDGLMVILDGALVDATAFLARFGDDLRVQVEFDDEITGDDVRDDDAGRGDDDGDDGDRDDDAGRGDDDGDDGDRDDDAGRGDDDGDDGDRDDDAGRGDDDGDDGDDGSDDDSDDDADDDAGDDGDDGSDDDSDDDDRDS